MNQVREALLKIANNEKLLKLVSDQVYNSPQDEEGNFWVKADQAALVFGLIQIMSICDEGKAKEYFGDFDREKWPYLTEADDYLPFFKMDDFADISRVIKESPEKEKIITRDLKRGDFIITVFNGC